MANPEIYGRGLQSERISAEQAQAARRARMRQLLAEGADIEEIHAGSFEIRRNRLELRTLSYLPAPVEQDPINPDLARLPILEQEQEGLRKKLRADQESGVSHLDTQKTRRAIAHNRTQLRHLNRTLYPKM